MVRKLLILLSIILIISGCGGIKEGKKDSGTPKLTVSPAEITHNTQFGDPGTWNRTQVVVSTLSSESGKDTPVQGKVKISNTSSFIKIYDEDGLMVAPAAEITTKSAYTLTIDYFSEAKPNSIEYSTNIIFQFQSASAILTIKVSKPGDVTFSLKSSPQKIEHESGIGDTGTWRSTNLMVILFADTEPISDELFVFLSNATNIRVIDTKGNNITASTVKTDADGRTTLIVQYYTKEGLEYTDSIQIFYDNISISIPINITAEKPVKVTTTVIPDKLDFKAPASDTGTWRAQYFTVYTKDSNGELIGNAKVNLSVSSSYTNLDINGQQHNTYSTTTDSNGTYTAKVNYYTQSSPSKVEYSASFIANEAIVPITITAESQAQTTYNLTAAPTSFTYAYIVSDTGTWRTQWFVIVLTDNQGNTVPNADLTIVSPNSQYTKLYDSSTEKPSPMLVRTDANGQYNLRLDFYTQADYSINPPVKTTYLGQLIISYKQYIKTINFSVQ